MKATTLLLASGVFVPPASGEKVIVHEIQEAQEQFRPGAQSDQLHFKQDNVDYYD